MGWYQRQRPDGAQSNIEQLTSARIGWSWRWRRFRSERTKCSASPIKGLKRKSEAGRVLRVRLKERELIERIKRKVLGSKTRAPLVIAGIGDDAAVLGMKPGHEVLVTTDFSLEGVHFRRDWLPAWDIGRRCLVRGLSDIAAMGGEPIAAFLSLALPKPVEQRWVDEFFNGLLKLAKRYGVTLAGGDVAQSPKGIVADIVVVGQAPKGEALMRSGARAGDGIYVTGTLGGAAAHIGGLRPRPARGRAVYKESLPRIESGQELREVASACIDVSDGLSTDLSHICEESGVGFAMANLLLRCVPRLAFGCAHKAAVLCR